MLPSRVALRRVASGAGQDTPCHASSSEVCCGMCLQRACSKPDPQRLTMMPSSSEQTQTQACLNVGSSACILQCRLAPHYRKQHTVAAHLGVDAEPQHIGLQVNAALIAPQHVQAKQEVWALLHNGDAHRQMLGPNLRIHLRPAALQANHCKHPPHTHMA